jgi:cation transporter-like permease
MTIQLVTHGDALRHTAGRVVVAASLTVVLNWSMTLMQFGTDPDATAWPFSTLTS